MARMGEGRSVYAILVGKLEGKNPLKNPGVKRSLVIFWIFMKWDVGLQSLIELVPDTDRWWALLNAVMNIRVA